LNDLRDKDNELNQKIESIINGGCLGQRGGHSGDNNCELCKRPLGGFSSNEGGFGLSPE